MAWAKRRVLSDGEVRYTACYRDAHGRERSAGTAPTKRLALELAQDQEALIRRREWRDPDAGAVLLRDYFRGQWLPNRTYETTTAATYRTHFTQGIEPELGGVALRDLSPALIQGWVGRQLRAGASATTVRARFKTLQTILAARRGASALRDGLIRTNPCAGVEVPLVPAREVTVYTSEQIAAAVFCLDSWWHPLVQFAVETGCRWGELQGLLVSDIWAQRAHVRRTIVETTKATTGTGTRFLTKPYPKNRHPRIVQLSPELSTLVAATAQARQLEPTDRLFARRNRKHPETIMRTREWPDGLPVSRNYFGDVWKRACAAAGVPVLRTHDLRATNISWMSAGGADLATIMQRVGHRNVVTTQRYLAPLPDADERALAALKRVQGT